MATDTSYAAFIMEQLSMTPGVSNRAMMGEYVVYCREKVVGGIYDNRLMVKITPSSAALLADAPREEPYPGAKPLLVVENVDDRELLRELMEGLYADLPVPKKRPKKPN